MDRKVYLIKLINSCPFKNAHSDCPINGFRNAPIADLVKIIDRLSEEKILMITQQHVKCYKRRKKVVVPN